MAGWFYNDVSGTLNRVPTALEAPYLVPLSGWHELLVPYSATRAQALAEAQKEFPKGATPGGAVVPNVGGQVTNAATGLFPGLSGLIGIGDFFQRLTEPATWARVGEVVFGGILLYVGVRAMTQGSTTAGVGARKSVTRPVKKVAKTTVRVAAPEVRLATRTAAKRAAPKTTARVAAHRQNVAKYGQRKPYTPPAQRQPTVRISHIHHHKAGP